MKVICAGFPKTGTKTLNAALTELGYECYDYMENCRFLHDEWMKVFRVGGSTEDFRRMFENVDAVMDMPSCFFWEEIHCAFPDAKIIFNQRATEEEWWRSMHAQLRSNEHPALRLMSLLSPSMWKMNRYGVAAIRAMFGMEFKTLYLTSPHYNEMLFKKKYREHNNYLLEKAPKDQLLMIDFNAGWGPLCEFLGVPVPDSPFPYKNKGASITQEMLDKDPFIQRLKVEVVASGSLLFLLSAFGIYRLATRGLPNRFQSYSKALWGSVATRLGL